MSKKLQGLRSVGSLTIFLSSDLAFVDTAVVVFVDTDYSVAVMK